MKKGRQFIAMSATDLVILNPEALVKEKVKSQQSSKMGFYCTSFITAVDNGEKICVTIGKEHYGHDTEIEHLRISQEDRTSIACKYGFLILKFKKLLSLTFLFNV